MKKCLMVIVLLLSLMGCKTYEVVKEVEVIRQDTTIVTLPDSASLIAALECDSNLQVVLKELQVSNGNNIQVEPKVVYKDKIMYLETDCKTDSLEQVITSLRESRIEKEYITEYIDKPIPRYYKFTSWAFWIITISVLLYIAARILIRIYLHK